MIALSPVLLAWVVFASALLGGTLAVWGGQFLAAVERRLDGEGS